MDVDKKDALWNVICWWAWKFNKKSKTPIIMEAMSLILAPGFLEGIDKLIEQFELWTSCGNVFSNWYDALIMGERIASLVKEKHKVRRNFLLECHDIGENWFNSTYNQLWNFLEETSKTMELFGRVGWIQLTLDRRYPCYYSCKQSSCSIYWYTDFSWDDPIRQCII